MVYPALIPLMRAPRLPVVERTDEPADLNGLVNLTERRNLFSARVSSHFKRSLPILCRKLLPASHQYETLEQIHRTACSHITNVMVDHTWISHTHTHTHTHMTIPNDIACWNRRHLFMTRIERPIATLISHVFQIIFS